MQSSPSHNSPIRLAASLFFLALILSILSHVQINDEFRALNKVFSIKKFDKAEISFPLEKAESFQMQIIYRTEGKEPANLSLFINAKKAKDIEIKGAGTQRTKFAAPRSFFAKGKNQISWELIPLQPGILVDEIKLTNYVGINPNIPTAWVIPDEFAADSLSPDKGAYHFATFFFWVVLALTLYIALCHLFFYNNLQNCLSDLRKFLIVPTLTLSASFFYSVFTPQKILFPAESALWLIGLSLLATHLPVIIVRGALSKSSAIKSTGVAIAIICLISILAYLPYFKNAWYVQDDYMSIHASLDDSWYSSKIDTLAKSAQSGIFNSILDSTKNITKWLYEGQGRYQPVRLFIFTAFTYLFQEEQSPYVNFALHLANLTLLFLLLRKFKTEPVAILITVLLFSLFGRWRMMESPSIMIAGSGLNFFLISLTLLFLINALETTASPARKIFFFSMSWISYFCLVFSYEIAFPLILPIICTYLIFNPKPKGERIWEKISCLVPYLIWLGVYILFFKLPAKGTYPGTTISWNIADIWTRLINYMDYTVSLRINLKHMGATEIIILLLYYMAASLAVNPGKSSCSAVEQKHNNWKTLSFGLAFYFSSVILFTLNSWESPNNIMIHHIYLMTVGASILTVFLLFQAQWFLPGATFLTTSNSRRVFRVFFLKKPYRHFLIFVFFPLVLVSEGNYTSRYYAQHDVGTAHIKPIKMGAIKQVDPEQTDAVIIKNFHHNYHGMSSVEGAFMLWFNFKKFITAGREITSADNDKIAFMRPLGYYWPRPHMPREAKNKRTHILFLENKTLLSYYDFLSFEEGINLHQTQQVWGDQEPEEYRRFRLDAILKNSNRGDFLEIKTKSAKDLDLLIENTTRIEVNGRPIRRILISGESLFIDICSAKESVNYFFLTLVSTDKDFKDRLQLIRLQNPGENAVARDIANILIGADSWPTG